MQQQTPAVGRVVHYLSHGSADGEYASECQAAIITAVDNYRDEPLNEEGVHVGHVSLAVFSPVGVHFQRASTHQQDERLGGSWHWPERV